MLRGNSEAVMAQGYSPKDTGASLSVWHQNDAPQWTGRSPGSLQVMKDVLVSNVPLSAGAQVARVSSASNATVLPKANMPPPACMAFCINLPKSSLILSILPSTLQLLLCNHFLNVFPEQSLRI